MNLATTALSRSCSVELLNVDSSEGELFINMLIETAGKKIYFWICMVGLGPRKAQNCHPNCFINFVYKSV